ncbi:MAG: dihydrodipicolinate synthase family protein [Xanthobacteraceae bacterium]
MHAVRPGLVHTPVMPFTGDHRIDFDRFGQLIDFHLRHGADALALPMHAAESVSLSEDEKRGVLAFAIERVRGRVPMIAHVSNAGTAIAAQLARDAQAAGAAAVVATTPYYWTPPQTMLLEHFVQIGAAVDLPLFVDNAPEEMAGTKVTTELMLKLIAELPNFAGVVDLSLDWQFMIELMTEAPRRRPDFQLLSGTEHMVSAGAIGATGMFSSLAAIAPRLVRRLYELCREQKFFAARPVQEQVAALRQVSKSRGPAGLKAALRIMGRDCGEPRPPLLPLDGSAYEKLAAELAALSALRDEPRGW